MGQDRDNADYKAGYDDGRSSTFVDKVMDSLSRGIPIPDTRSGEIYNKGFDEGVRDQQDHGSRGDSGSSGGGGGGGGDGPCYVTPAFVDGMSLPDDWYEMQLLRSFRDMLLKTTKGRKP